MKVPKLQQNTILLPLKDKNIHIFSSTEVKTRSFRHLAVAGQWTFLTLSSIHSEEQLQQFQHLVQTDPVYYHIPLLSIHITCVLCNFI